MPADAHAILIVLAAELQAMQTLIASIEKRIMAQHRASEESQRVETIPGIGVVGATAITATVTDPKIFRSGRDFAAWIGLVPRQDFDRRQAEARADLETGRSLFATHSGGRGALRSCGTRASSQRNIRGSRSFSPANRSRSWQWRSPTRWRASPGRCWPRAAPIGRLRLRQRRKRTGDGKMRLRMCVHELQG